MNSHAKHPVTIRRILVALDTSPHSLAALEAAANLAARLEATLTGIFVEDVNLLRLAQLPFAQEIRYPSGVPEKLDVPAMEKLLEKQAVQARHELRQTAEERSLVWSFRISRGVMPAELLAAALDTDLLVLGRISHRPWHAHRLGSTAKMALAQRQYSVLLMHPDFDLDQPVLVFYDGSEAAERALILAAGLAQTYGRLYILLWAVDEDEVRQHERHVTAQLAGEDLEIIFYYWRDIGHVAAVIERSNAGLIVLGNADSHVAQAIKNAVLPEIEYPVLLVR